MLNVEEVGLLLEAARGPKDRAALGVGLWGRPAGVRGGAARNLRHRQHPHADPRHLAPVRAAKWVVYSKPPFGGPEAVLAYLSRYAHRVAISYRRLISRDEAGVTDRCKDYRRDGDARHDTMTLSADDSIRRFLVDVRPFTVQRRRPLRVTISRFGGATT